ncbi:hypothetical protein [Hymenobacter psoromatis]|uniref:hypothetical protein n=1 Tax=Hymenobacter psoromatis TaxID=1484116 RepID=UPI001CBC7817|nr:hypothetical protein [Hymenobacter psoromatis]
MRRNLFFSLFLIIGLSLGLSSCAPGVYTSASIGTGYGYPAYGYGYGGYYGPRYYGPRYYAPRPIIVAPRVSYRGGFGGGERGWHGGGGGGHYGSRRGR